jgi:hypothetical protein
VPTRNGRRGTGGAGKENRQNDFANLASVKGVEPFDIAFVLIFRKSQRTDNWTDVEEPHILCGKLDSRRVPETEKKVEWVTLPNRFNFRKKLKETSDKAHDQRFRGKETGFRERAEVIHSI